MLGSHLGYTDSLVKSTAAGTHKDKVTPFNKHYEENINRIQNNKPNVHPLTPINEAYLELWQNKNKLASSRNLNFNDGKDHDSLECDEELEMEQARDEIASLESENAEIVVNSYKPPRPFNYNKKATKPSAQNSYYNDMSQPIKNNQNNLQTFYNNENIQYLSYDSHKTDEDGEPYVEYVHPNSFLNPYGSYSRSIKNMNNYEDHFIQKYSIYSPSNRLYTVEEVNSTASDIEASSHFKFSNKNYEDANMTNSLIFPMTPNPKVSKVMSTKKIRTKTDKQDLKVNGTLLGGFVAPNSSKFLFKTVSSLPSNKIRDLGSPSIPLSSILMNNDREIKSKKNLTNENIFYTKKLENNKLIKLSAEKPQKLSAKKKIGTTRNISTGDINQIFHDGSSGGSFITTEDVIVASIPLTECKKSKNPDLLIPAATNAYNKVVQERLSYTAQTQKTDPNNFG